MGTGPLTAQPIGAEDSPWSSSLLCLSPLLIRPLARYFVPRYHHVGDGFVRRGWCRGRRVTQCHAQGLRLDAASEQEPLAIRVRSSFLSLAQTRVETPA